MDRMKFTELFYKKYLDILKMDVSAKYSTYVYEGDVVMLVQNKNLQLFVYIKLLSDSEEYLKEAYKTLSDYETKLFVGKICGKVNQDG